MREPAARNRRWFMWAGKCLLAVLLLYLIASNVSSVSILQALSAARFPFIAAALLLLPLNLWLQYSKWKLMLRRTYPKAEVGDIRSSLLLGFTFGLATPARIGEFGGRAMAVRNTEPLTLMGITAIDKLATMAVTVAAGIIGLLLYGALHPFMDFGLLAVALTLIVFSVYAAGRSVYQRRSRLLKSTGWFGRTIRKLAAAQHCIDRRTMLRVLMLSVLFYATFLMQFFLLLSAFGPLDPVSTLAGISTIMLVKTVLPPITLGELGIREGVAVLVFGHAGVLAAAAFSASLLLFAINLLLPALAGLPLLVRMPRTSTAGPR